MFPYIRQLYVKDCYTYQDITIPKEATNKIKNILLTGKNGSGKTTILNRIFSLLNFVISGNNINNHVRSLQSNIDNNPNHPQFNNWIKQIKELTDVQLIFHTDDKSTNFSESDYSYFLKNKNEYIFSYFKANRKVQLQDVTTVTQEKQFTEQLKNNRNPDSYMNLFKQYLVNKKVYEAFDHMKSINSNQNNIFFDNLENVLKSILNDDDLKLDFSQEEFEFYIHLHDERKIRFNDLSEGFSAFFSILIDLLMKTDIIRKEKKDFSFNPSGIILIDEPETHFHLEMQYDILPLLTNLFPNIQFIIATHSPAIISSISDSIIYDLTSKQYISNSLEGNSYTELMINHFGLKNEYSPKVDELLRKFSTLYENNEIEKLNTILQENIDILTPSLKVELESRIIELEHGK